MNTGTVSCTASMKHAVRPLKPGVRNRMRCDSLQETCSNFNLDQKNSSKMVPERACGILLLSHLIDKSFSLPLFHTRHTPRPLRQRHVNAPSQRFVLFLGVSHNLLGMRGVNLRRERTQRVRIIGEEKCNRKRRRECDKSETERGWKGRSGKDMERKNCQDRKRETDAIQRVKVRRTQEKICGRLRS